MFWAVDPAVSYPRFQSRYAPNPVGVHLPNGRADRTVIAVDVGSERGPDDADVRIQMTAAEEAPFLASLRASLAGRTIGDAPLVARVTELATRLARAKYAVVVTDVESPPEVPNGRLDSLIALTSSLNATTRGSLCTLRAGGNRNGARLRAHLADRIPHGSRLRARRPRYHPEDAALPRLTARRDRRRARRRLGVRAAAGRGERASWRAHGGHRPACEREHARCRHPH